MGPFVAVVHIPVQESVACLPKKARPSGRAGADIDAPLTCIIFRANARHTAHVPTSGESETRNQDYKSRLGHLSERGSACKENAARTSSWLCQDRRGSAVSLGAVSR